MLQVLIAFAAGIAVTLQGQFMGLLDRTLGTRESVFITYGSRFFEQPPEGRAHANAEDVPPPAGTQVRYSPESIGYGLNRVLWWEGSWIELSTDLPVAALGVQFLGAPQIGWSRILLDGEEVWRGNTSELGYNLGQYGGYVEVSGFHPGPHTLGVESLGWDYRPVTVASFGYRPGEQLPAVPERGVDSAHAWRQAHPAR